MTVPGVLVSMLSTCTAVAAMVMWINASRAVTLRAKLRFRIVSALSAEAFVVIFIVRILSLGEAYTAWPFVVGGVVVFTVATVLLGRLVLRWNRELKEIKG